MLDALLVVVVGLRYGRVGLVRAGRRDALVLEVNPGGGVEGLFERRGADERRGSPDFIDFLHLFRNIDEALGRHLLVDELFGEDGRHLLLGDGLLGGGIQGRQGLVGHVGHDVVPLGGHLTLGEADFFRFHGVEILEDFEIEF